ncbi:MAG TPA: hypothetical protein PK633_02125 [Agitococcus sp.]|nr:hypothetical protein [Agitococcus sp.]
MDIIQKTALQSFFISVLALAITACGGGGGDDSAPAASNNSNTDSKQFVSSGIYHATNGSGYSDFHKLKLEKGGYLDITMFKSQVGLYNSSLGLIDENLDNTDYIAAGEYNLKFGYQPTSLIPGTVTIFSLELKKYNDLPSIESKKYNASGSLGTYSEYYKLDLTSGSFIDVTTTKASVYAYNKTLFGNDGMPLISHYEKITGNKYLEAGEYVVKFTYDATSLTPGTVTFQKN